MLCLKECFVWETEIDFSNWTQIILLVDLWEL